MKAFWIERLRTLAMMVIVLAHANDFFALRDGNIVHWRLLVATLVCFTVPLFFCLSGYLMAPQFLENRVAPQRFIKSKLKRLLMPMLLWNVVYMFAIHHAFKGPLFNGDTLWFMTTGYLHLYFNFLLLQLMLGTLLLWRFGISLGSRWVFAISLLTAVAFYTLSEVLLWTQGADDHFFEWRLGKMFVGWSFFFVYGFWLRARPTWLGAIVTRRIWWSLAALFALAGFHYETWQQFLNFGDNHRQYFLLTGLLFQFLMINALIGWFHKEAEPEGNDHLARSGSRVYGIYLSHNLFYLLIFPFWITVPLSPALKVIIAAMGCWLFANGLVMVYDRFLKRSTPRPNKITGSPSLTNLN